MTTEAKLPHPKKTNYLDLVCETYSHQQAELEEVNAELMRALADALEDVATYGEIATAAIHKLHEFHTVIARERTQRYALAEEFRAFRRWAMVGSLRPRRSDTPTRRRPAHVVFDSGPTERPMA